jgi:hypothetical protein
METHASTFLNVGIYDVLELIYLFIFQFRNQYDNDVTVWSPQVKQCFVLFIILFVYFDKGSHYVAQAGLELRVLSQPPKCWDYMCTTIPSYFMPFP